MKGQHCHKHRPLPCCTAPALQWEAGRPGVQGWSAASPAAPCLVHVILQAAEPAVLLIDLPDSQDAVQHALQHAPVHGDDRVPEWGLGNARPFGLQVEDIIAVPQILRTVKREEGEPWGISYRGSESLACLYGYQGDLKVYHSLLCFSWMRTQINLQLVSQDQSP